MYMYIMEGIHNIDSKGTQTHSIGWSHLLHRLPPSLPRLLPRLALSTHYNPPSPAFPSFWWCLGRRPQLLFDDKHMTRDCQISQSHKVC